jgi:uncharacterized membrane protein
MAWTEYPGVDALFLGNVLATLGAVPLLIYYVLVVDGYYNDDDGDDGGVSDYTFALASVIAIVLITIGLIIVTYYSTPSRIYAGLFYHGNPHSSPPEGCFQRHIGTGFLLGASIMTLSFFPYFVVGIWYLENQDWYDGFLYVIGSLLYLGLMLLGQWALLPDIGAHPEHGVMGKFLQTSCGRFICCAKKEKKVHRVVSSTAFLGMGGGSGGGGGNGNGNYNTNTSTRGSSGRNRTSGSRSKRQANSSMSGAYENIAEEEEELDEETTTTTTTTPEVWSDQWLIDQMGSDLMFSTILGVVLFIYWIVDVIVGLSADSSDGENWANLASIVIFFGSVFYYAKASLTLEGELVSLGKHLKSSTTIASETTRLVPYEEGSSRNSNHSVVV